MLHLENEMTPLNQVIKDSVPTDYYIKPISPGCQRFISIDYFQIHLKIFGYYFISLVQSYAVLPATAKISYAISHNGSVLVSVELKVFYKRLYSIYCFHYPQVND